MKEKRKNSTGRQKTVRGGWFLSYLLVLAVPLALCILLYFYSSQVITREAKHVYGSALDQVTIDLDSYLTEINQVQEYVMLEPSVQIVTRVDSTLTPNDQYNMVAARAALGSTLINHPNISDVWVAINGADGVISPIGYTSQPLFYSLVFDNSSLSEEEMRAQFRASHTQWDMLPVHNSDGRDYLLFLRSTMENGIGSSNGTVVVAVKKDLFLKRLYQFQWDSGLNYYMLDKDGGALFQTDAEPLPVDAAGLSTGDNFQFVGDRAYLRQASSVSGNQYVLSIETALLLRNTRQTQFVTWAGLMICMIGGLLLSAKLTQRSFHPLNALLTRYALPEEPLADKNEFEKLDYYLQRFSHEKGDAQHDLWKSQQTLRKFYLLALLEHPAYTHRGDPAACGVSLDSPWYMVLLFSNPLLPRPGLNTPDLAIQFEQLQFAILNIFQEAAEPHFALELTDAGEAAVAIIGLKAPGSGPLRQLEEDVRFTAETVQELFHVTVQAALSDVHAGVDGIHDSYREALEALSYLRSGEDAELVTYREICDARRMYSFPVETERKLIDLVAAGGTAGAVHLVRQSFPLEGEGAIPNGNVARCLSYDIAAALFTGAGMGGVENLQGLPIDEPTPAASLQEMQDRLADTAAALCEQVRQRKGSSEPVRQLCEQVQAYIRENYADPDLNISQTGLRFDITPTYLSTLFKRETGMSLLGYITQIRVDAAKALLAQGLSVSRIAELTGFRDSGSLIRTFKKATGMTPGQYRSSSGT